MNRKSWRFAALLGITGILAGCSNLFENIYNEDGTEKTGISSLTTPKASSNESANTDIYNGLVVIKASEPGVNQISYSEDQNIYYVGKLPDGYSDSTFSSIKYTNGSQTPLLAKDDPVEFRCYVDDENSTWKWTAVQTWRYLPEVQTKRTTDADGNEITYTSIVSERAEALSEPATVNIVPVKSGDWSIVHADIPFGVTVVTCTVTADDTQYTSTHSIVLTKRFITTVADSASEDSEESGTVNTVTDHGLVVIKATQPGLNAINYSSTTYDYEIGDSTGADTSGDLTGRDDPVTFKCYLLDSEAKLTWSARQTQRYVPVTGDTGGVLAQTLQVLDTPVKFDILESGDTAEGSNPFLRYDASSTDTAGIVTSNLPYGTTEVFATITAQNENPDGELVTDTTQYKITLTKRYVITAAAGVDESSGQSGLAVYANGKEGSLISYSAEKTSYSVTGLNGSNDPVTITFAPEEPAFTTLTWSATQTQSYEANLATYTSGEVTYTYQSGGSFVDLASPVDLISSGIVGESESSTSQKSIYTGNLPYGTTVVTVRAASTEDEDSATTYTVTLKKKQVVTNVNIVSSDDENSNISLVTDAGLVVISAQEPDINQISFSSSKNDYQLSGITAADNDMGFRLFLADTEAKVSWDLTQVKTFTAVTETTETTSYDSYLGTSTTVTTTKVTGQTEEDCDTAIDFSFDDTFSDNQAITATIPYGLTVVTATVTSPDGSSVYTISLTRDIYTASSSSGSSNSIGSSESTDGNYSKLSDLTVDIGGDETSSASLTPAFDPDTTVYRVSVEDDADSITIDATAASSEAVISSPVAITKYGTVPGTSGNTVQLVGGTSKITFTVTDETGISRTYTIYVTKTADGDTSLSALSATPSASFANGIAGFTVDTSYKGSSSSGTAKYAMTLSADSRVDVTSLTFTAVPANSRTTVAYGLSSSVSSLPSSWTESYSRATQTGSFPASQTVSIGDEDSTTITRILWVKTVSDSYYHTSSTSSTGYESEKRADTSYHAVKISKAGDANQNLTALKVIATYEDGSTKTILSQGTTSTVAYQTSAASTKVTTYADQLDFYFRPLDKDASVTYTAVNSAYSGGEENMAFTGRAASAREVSALSGDYFSDGSDEYYHFTLGEIFKANGVDSQTADLPNGRTSVTICGVTYTFIKPDLTDCSYSVNGWEGNESGVDTSSRTSYIYVANSVTQLALSLSVSQQNATVSVTSVTQTADANGSSPESQTDASYSVYKKDASDGEETNVWKVLIGSTSDSSDSISGYSLSSSGNGGDAIEIPVGTTKVLLSVNNNGTSIVYTYYIVRASDSESRLKSLVFGGTKISLDDWTTDSDSDTSYVYVPISEAYTIDAGAVAIKAEAVSSAATISLSKSHSATNGVSAADYESESWSAAESLASVEASLSTSYTICEEDAGSLLFTVTVTSEDETTSHTYYIIAYVEADPTAELTALKIIQKGSEGTDYSYTILANSFDAKTLSYPSLSASLSYTGSIVITPAVYEKASITSCSVTLSGESVESNCIIDESSWAIEIPYSFYSTILGSSISVSYSVQAQDTSVDPVTYTADIALPKLTTITDTETFTTSTEYEYILPAATTDSLVAYRFGSVIADESQFLGSTKSYFGGIDIIGTQDRTNWYESSFAQSGFQLAVNVDGIDYWVGLDEQGEAKTFYTVDFDSTTVTEVSEAENPGITLSVSPSFQYEGETPYLALTFALENPDGKEVKLGASIDTLVGSIEDCTKIDNDSVTVEETDNGFVMAGRDYSFRVVLKNAYGVDDVSRLWYGAYDPENFTHMKVFEDGTSSLASGDDSAASFSWDLGSDTSIRKTIRITMEP